MNHKHSKTNNQSQTTNNQLQTTKKELRKIHSFMQNKPNLLNARMNVSKVLAKDYENVHPLGHPKTNPKQTQFKPNTNSERGADPYGQASRNPQTGDQFKPKKHEKCPESASNPRPESPDSRIFCRDSTYVSLQSSCNYF